MSEDKRLVYTAGISGKNLNKFVEMECFQGNAATSVKTYIQEVHGILLVAIRQTLMEYQSRVLLYKGGYYGLEPNVYACIPQESMSRLKERMKSECEALAVRSEAIGGILSGISDLLSLSNPSPDDLTITLQAVAN